MAARPTGVIDAVLRGYAQRGVFRALDAKAGAGGVTVYTLHWLTDAPMRWVVARDGRTLTLKNLLPDVGARSEMHKSLQRFIDERLGGGVPEHRRIDPRMLDIQWVVARRKATLVAKIGRGDTAAITRRIVNLVHELFIHLHSEWAEYMWTSFGASSE